MQLSIYKFSGFVMDFISGPVIFGFCSAAATTVIFSQIKILLGLKFRGSAFVTVISGIFTNWQAIRLWDAGLGLAFIVLLLLLKVLACVLYNAKEKKFNNNQLLSEFDSDEDKVQKHLLPSSPSRRKVPLVHFNLPQCPCACFWMSTDIHFRFEQLSTF